MSSTTDAQMKSEIARLTASINQHKYAMEARGPQTYKRSNTYTNPNYNPSIKSSNTSSYNRSYSQPRPNPGPSSAPVKEVVLNGVAFQSSGRSLVRKDSNGASSQPQPSATRTPGQMSAYSRKSGHLIPASRVYKPKAVRGRNMTLANSRRPYQFVTWTTRLPKRKYLNRPCPRFSTTGACNRGQTCMYQHDPSKIAICWSFLQGNCSNTAETCNLSHDPIPERTPLCLHFLNKGRCTRENCPYPHVNVGARLGVCRDFAVLGYCEKGLDCDKQHVRECPDFAERGACSTKGCKLPHVIRANRNRGKAPASKAGVTSAATGTSSTSSKDSTAGGTGLAQSGTTDAPAEEQRVSVADAQLGDEFISLTFNESDDSEEDDEDDGDEAEEGDNNVNDNDEEDVEDEDEEAISPR
ncbi:hypothetical protein BDN72DRAFT_811845 [Pluteus cervinus]|uniref:Uncharacterized protein n=1 Tax=Pluteus cervinus TaxID=181527 RepID=A0ACD3BAZ3_9AGAR|nr:hypothetical protein BDN72DRAFT_811845 [Pluteus cervinus]